MNLQHMNTRSLYRDIIRSCWAITIIYLIGTSIELSFTDYDRTLFFWNAIALPAIKMIALNATMGWVFRRVQPYSKYILITGINLFICIIIFSLYNLPIVIYSLIIPILLSLYFYSKRLIIFALVQSLLTVAVILFTLPGIRAGLSSSNLIMLLALLSATALIINSLRKHAFALFEQLIKVTQEKQDLQTKNELMEQLNRVDSATGLYNHRSFHEHLVKVIETPDNYAYPTHLAILDIDHFKRVNDTYGHAVGDVAIKFVARQLSLAMDPSDFVARYGGEEFAVVCIDKRTEHVIEQLEQLRQSIAQHKLDHLGGESVTISIGIQKLLPGMSKEELFQQADEALYRAKKSGRNQTMVAGREGCMIQEQSLKC